MPVNFRLAADEIAYILRHSGSAGVVAGLPVPDESGLRFVIEVGDDYETRLAAVAPRTEPVALAEDDAALMCYTSGTTGRPRAPC